MGWIEKFIVMSEDARIRFEIKVIIAIIFLISVLVGCNTLREYFNLKDDHPIEDQIEEYVDINLDLTPSSHENIS